MSEFCCNGCTKESFTLGESDKKVIINSTIDYYNKNAEEYVKKTLSVDMNPAIDRFLSYVKPGGSILDIGCGSCRDSLVFRDKGYNVTPMDASKELCNIVRKKFGFDVINMRFEDIDFKDRFDAAWACASLLHVSYPCVLDVLSKISASLKDGGILFASFKCGRSVDYDENLRFFRYYIEDDMEELFNESTGFKIIETWRFKDILQRDDTEWINVICRKI